MVSVEGLVKEFKIEKGGVLRVVDSISFEAKSGQVFGLIGDNGAGKTTTLRVITTLLKPNKGRIEVAGFDTQTHGIEARASLGFLSGTTGLYARLTPRELLTYFGNLYGISGGDLKSRINALAEELGLGEFLDKPCDKLSTGQKQRTGIARAVLHDPEVLLLDEPTAGLDVQASQSMLEFIERARTLGRTIIYTSHIMSEVERLCDDLIVLHEGRIVGHGTVEQLKISTGQTSFERAFLSLVEYKSSQGAAL